jgi:macrolide transport system ATP-binding/permease protein
MTSWGRRFVWWFQRKRREEVLRAELEFHLDEEANERRENGLSEEQAAWAARRDLGNVTRIKEDTRALWSWTLLEQLIQDLRFAARTMVRSRTVTVVTALTLALGIGANTAIFSFMDAILLRALPVPDPASLVVVKWHSKQIAFGPRAANQESDFVLHEIDGQVYDEAGGSTSRVFPYPAFERLQQVAAPVMASLFAYRPAGRLNVVTRGDADVAQGEYVTGGYFDGLGVTPAAGRPIQVDDDRTGARSVAVLSLSYARRRFGDAGAAIDQVLLINNRPFTIVGVAPAEFFGVDPSRAPDVYLPLHAGRVSPDPNYYWLEMMGRLRSGLAAADAQAALAAAFQPWVATTVTTPRERLNLPQLRLDPGAGGLDTLRRRYSQPLFVLMGMVGLILAIACANTANLLLARAALRRREMAVRLSIGAGRFRVVRQLLTESILLACLGGALSIPIAFASMQVLTAMLANGQESFTLHAELNWQVLMATLGLSLACGVLFGLAPALQSAQPSIMPALRDGGSLQVAGSPRFRSRRFSLTQMLVVSQIAVSLILLVAAGLFVRTLANLQSIDLGFNAERVLLLDVNARQSGHTPEGIAAFYDDLRRRFAAVPGVSAVTLSHASLIRAGRSLSLSIAGAPAHGARVLSVGPEFFTTMGIRIVQGRGIDERDSPGGPAVAVVSELFARTFLSGQSAVGHRLTLDLPVTVLAGAPAVGGPMDLEIVGVAATARYGDLRDRTPPVVYLPYGQIVFPPIAQMTFALRTPVDPLSYVAAVRQTVREADPQLPVTNVRTQAVEIDRTINQEILFARLCSAFAILALLIACVGLYGTLAYAVARRTNEIGLRMALGASGAGVQWMVLREICVLAAIGLTISVPTALAASRLVQDFLFDVAPNDPYTFAGAALVLTIAAMVAGYGPARRASRISPMTALRAD